MVICYNRGRFESRLLQAVHPARRNAFLRFRYRHAPAASRLRYFAPRLRRPTMIGVPIVISVPAMRRTAHPVQCFQRAGTCPRQSFSPVHIQHHRRLVDLPPDLFWRQRGMAAEFRPLRARLLAVNLASCREVGGSFRQRSPSPSDEFIFWSSAVMRN